MRILVCGGRDYTNEDKVYSVLDELRPTFIINGDASGADYFSTRWARGHYVPYRLYKADWNRYGKAAGPIRNLKMLECEKVDLVVAFPGGKGTDDMISKAKAAGIPVKEIG